MSQTFGYYNFLRRGNRPYVANSSYMNWALFIIKVSMILTSQLAMRFAF